jgi:hypothetical protein
MTGPSLQFGDIALEIKDPLSVQPVSADVLTETRVFSNVVCLSFANIVTDGDGQPEARISGRIRLTLPGAMDLRNALDRLLEDVMPGKEKGN